MRGSSIFFSREHPLDYFHTPPLQLSPLPPPPPKNRHEKNAQFNTYMYFEELINDVTVFSIFPSQVFPIRSALHNCRAERIRNP